MLITAASIIILALLIVFLNQIQAYTTTTTTMSSNTINNNNKPLAVIMGVGDGLSASLARLLYQEGYRLVLAARNVSKLDALAQETQATCVACDATSADEVQKLFQEHVMSSSSKLAVAIYNPSRRVRGPIQSVDPVAVKEAMDVTAYGSFLFGQQAAKVMLLQQQQNTNTSGPGESQPHGGTILFTGASAGVKGFAQSAAFAMGKFAQRGLVESMARELHPQNIHVAWINIDGGIRTTTTTNRSSTSTSCDPDDTLDPNEIAKTYLALIQQHRSVWSHEIAVRPWVEKF